MPKREDERYANLRDNLAYCSAHKLHYRIGVGCPACTADQVERHIHAHLSVELTECRRCGQKSLFLNPQTDKYECLNRNCNPSPAKQSNTGLCSTGGETGRAWFNNQYFDQKSRRWKSPRSRTSLLGKVGVALFCLVSVVVVFGIVYLLLTHNLSTGCLFFALSCRQFQSVEAV